MESLCARHITTKYAWLPETQDTLDYKYQKFLSYYPLESIIMIESKQEVSMDTNDIEQDLIINSCLLIGE